MAERTFKRVLCIRAKQQDRTKGKSGNMGKCLLASETGFYRCSRAGVDKDMLLESQEPLELTSIEIGNKGLKAKYLEQMYDFSPRQAVKHALSGCCSSDVCLKLCESNLVGQNAENFVIRLKKMQILAVYLLPELSLVRSQRRFQMLGQFGERYNGADKMFST